jgi:hypothetical protein
MTAPEARAGRGELHRTLRGDVETSLRRRRARSLVRHRIQPGAVTAATLPALSLFIAACLSHPQPTVATVASQDLPFGRVVGPMSSHSPSTSGQVEMPDLTGDTVAEAMLALRRVGLTLCHTKGAEPTSNPDERGKVIGQSPPAGLKVPSATAVTVITGAADDNAGWASG